MEEEKINLEQINDRLQFLKKQTIADQSNDRNKIMIHKM